MRQWHLFVASFAGLLVAALALHAQDRPPQAQPNQPAAQQQVPPAGQDLTIRGRVIRSQAPDQIVVRTPDNKEMTFYSNPQTRYTIRGQAGQFSDLRADTDVNVRYIMRDNRPMVSLYSVGDAAVEPAQPAQPPAAQATAVEGTVVRVVGTDQVVIKVGDKEVIVYVSPQTKYTWDEKPGQFNDFRPGAAVRVEYDERDRRNVARTVLGRRR